MVGVAAAVDDVVCASVSGRGEECRIHAASDSAARDGVALTEGWDEDGKTKDVTGVGVKTLPLLLLLPALGGGVERADVEAEYPAG